MRTIVCETGEIVNSYKDYLKTDHWKKKRAAIRKKYGYKCRNCKTTKGLEVHHITYKNIGKEPLSNLTLLCRDCHQNAHDTSDAAPRMLKETRENRSDAVKYAKEKYNLSDRIENYYFLLQRKNMIIKASDEYYIQLKGTKNILILDREKKLVEKIKVKKTSL